MKPVPGFVGRAILELLPDLGKDWSESKNGGIVGPGTSVKYDRGWDKIQISPPFLLDENTRSQMRMSYYSYTVLRDPERNVCGISFNRKGLIKRLKSLALKHEAHVVNRKAASLRREKGEDAIVREYGKIKPVIDRAREYYRRGQIIATPRVVHEDMVVFDIKITGVPYWNVKDVLMGLTGSLEEIKDNEDFANYVKGH